MAYNTQNLVPFTSEQSREEAAKNGRKGGIASGEARRRRKAIKEQLKMLLGMPLKPGKNKNLIKGLGFNEDEIDNQLAMNYALFNQALKGNVKAFELIRDTIGEKPQGSDVPEEQVNNQIMNIADLINNPEKNRSENDV